MLILSVVTTSLLSSPSPSYSTHSVYAQQSADNLNKNTYKIAGNKDGNFIVQVNAKQLSNFREIIPSTTECSNWFKTTY
jgi:hypothetical protein